MMDSDSSIDEWDNVICTYQIWFLPLDSNEPGDCDTEITLGLPTRLVDDEITQRRLLTTQLRRIWRGEFMAVRTEARNQTLGEWRERFETLCMESGEYA
jgi:hypothetical protein